MTINADGTKSCTNTNFDNCSSYVYNDVSNKCVSCQTALVSDRSCLHSNLNSCGNYRYNGYSACVDCSKAT